MNRVIDYNLKENITSCTFVSVPTCTFVVVVNCTFVSVINCTFQSVTECTFEAVTRCTFEACCSPSSFYYWKSKFRLSRPYHSNRASSSLKEFAPINLSCSSFSSAGCDRVTSEAGVEKSGHAVTAFSQNKVVDFSH